MSTAAKIVVETSGGNPMGKTWKPNSSGIWPQRLRIAIIICDMQDWLLGLVCKFLNNILPRADAREKMYPSRISILIS